jgi:hypothetical protein
LGTLTGKEKGDPSAHDTVEVNPPSTTMD